MRKTSQILLILFFTCTMGSAQNLLINGSFEEPGTGKYRGDCLADGCFNDYVLGWHAPDDVTDSSVELDPQAHDGTYASSVYNMDGTIYQIVEEITNNREYELSYWARMSWSADTEGNDTHYFVTYFYAVDPNDESNLEIIDSLAEESVLPGYNQYFHSVVIPEEFIGKKLAIGYDVKSTTVSNAIKDCWVRFDDMILTTAQSTGINNLSENQIVFYPNPSTGIVQIKSTDEINAISVMDITGKVILTQLGGKYVDLTEVTNGMYFIQVESSFNLITKKIVIK